MLYDVKIGIFMLESIFIATIFFIGFFCESVFGFGGLLISFSILGFFIDIKEIVPIAIFVGMNASICVIITDYKSISFTLLFKRILPWAFSGTIVGVLLFSKLSSDLLLEVFAAFLFIIAIKSLLMDRLRIMRFFRIPLLFGGGIMQGIYGVGGPFTILAVKDEFNSKSCLRSTIALYFIVLNIIRIIQFEVTGVMHISEIFTMWWLVFPVSIAVCLGYKVHLKISETLFKKFINILLLISGIIYLIR